MIDVIHAYPSRFEPIEEGGVLITFRDVPEALTDSPDGLEALQAAEACLVTALAGYVKDRKPLPNPSAPRLGEREIAVSALDAAKLLLLDAMLDRGLSKAELARRLGTDERQVRRMLDFDHQSHIALIDEALKLLNRRLVLGSVAA